MWVRTRRAKRRRSRWQIWLPIAVAVAGLGILLASPFLAIAAFHGVQAQVAAASDAAAHHVNETVSDGSVDFTVRGTQCGLATVGGTAQPVNGQFCVVRVTVANHGPAPILSRALTAGEPPDAAALNSLPSPEAIAAVRRLGIRYAVLHTGVYSGVQQYTEEQARAVIDGLPLGARATRHGNSWLIDFSGMR